MICQHSWKRASAKFTLAVRAPRLLTASVSFHPTHAILCHLSQPFRSSWGVRTCSWLPRRASYCQDDSQGVSRTSLRTFPASPQSWHGLTMSCPEPDLAQQRGCKYSPRQGRMYSTAELHCRPIVCEHACMRVRMCVYVEASNTTYLLFEPGSPWNSLTRVGWLASEPRESPCLCPLSAGITGALSHTQLFIWVLGDN